MIFKKYLMVFLFFALAACNTNTTQESHHTRQIISKGIDITLWSTAIVSACIYRHVNERGYNPYSREIQSSMIVCGISIAAFIIKSKWEILHAIKQKQEQKPIVTSIKETFHEAIDSISTDTEPSMETFHESMKSFTRNVKKGVGQLVSLFKQNHDNNDDETSESIQSENKTVTSVCLSHSV